MGLKGVEPLLNLQSFAIKKMDTLYKKNYWGPLVCMEGTYTCTTF